MNVTILNMNLLERLREEKNSRLKGMIYHFTQIKMCYNSNKIEGSKLTEKQTRHIFETESLFSENENALYITDIIETVNHFRCFDYLLDNADKDLNEKIIKEFHKILKNNTPDSRKDYFNVGKYKLLENNIGGNETADPKEVPKAMKKLLSGYHELKKPTIEDITAFHFKFEKIHPFQDGNGRVGRLIMFKECLKHDIVPFIIDEQHRMFYYRGLEEFEKTPGYLTDTCRSAQDIYKKYLDRFKIRYKKI